VKPLQHMLIIHEVKLKEANPYGFKAAFNPAFSAVDSPGGLDLAGSFRAERGPDRSDGGKLPLGVPLDADAPPHVYCSQGLRRAGLTNGWLEDA
jgi:hypothetical protein